MSLDADLIVDRRRMRRKLTFWRVIAIGVVVLAVAGVAALGSNRAGFTGVRPYIARVTQFDRRSHKVSLSIKALEVAEEKEAIAEYGSSDSGASLGDILGAALKAREQKK